MPIVECPDAEFEGLINVARLMMVSARTAPKSGGRDDVETILIYGEDKDRIADEMEKIGRERDSKGFLRDGK
ncbi:MAG: hypothetical protein QXH17_05910, partial [Candidatus Bathyarchaeia archaeon]